MEKSEYRPNFNEGDLTKSKKDLRFLMRCNGFSLKDDQWSFDDFIYLPEDFEAQKVSFFGPGGGSNSFFSRLKSPEPFLYSFEQPAVTDLIRKYRKIDVVQAKRIAFLLGGIVNYMIHDDSNSARIHHALGFAARMIGLREAKSADAIATSIAMYIISHGSLEENNHFSENIYHMAKAIDNDPIFITETEDLGLSQLIRLKNFLNRDTNKIPNLSNIAEHKKALKGFPTVGAEFHFAPDEAKKYPNFWQRLAILNMSQYQKGSYIQLSRNDQEVIEIRMNPSIYPITIANWNHIRLLLPELNKTSFTITLNRDEGNFHWNYDSELLNQLRTIGMISYAGTFKNIPRIKKSEINFGSIYLGQTVKIFDGSYDFSGNWGGRRINGEGEHGQLAIYAGFGDNLPYLAYYLSMSLADPSVLEPVSYFSSQIKTLQQALNLEPYERRLFSIMIQNLIEKNQRLNEAFQAGNQLITLLNP